MLSISLSFGRYLQTTGAVRRVILAAAFAASCASHALADEAQTVPGAVLPEHKAAIERQIKHEKEIIADLQQRLQKVLEQRQTADDPQARAEVASLANEMGAHSVAIGNLARELVIISDGADAAVASAVETAQDTLRELHKKGTLTGTAPLTFLNTRKDLALREQQLAMMQSEMAKMERANALPPLENAEVKVYPLRFASPAEAADTLSSLFGAQTIRVASDDRTKALVVVAKPNAVPAIDALLQQLDRHGDDAKGTNATPLPHSLMLRLFWLADGLPETVGQDASMFLPDSVIRAVMKLGLEAPRLVTQTVNALAMGGDEPVAYSTSVPAIMLGRYSTLEASGKVRPGDDDAVAVDINLTVQGGSTCDLRGSLAMPLGHYMVLGTTNSVSSTADPNAGGEGESGGAFPNAEGAMPPSEPQFRASRFAFVAQVIEGESYPPEEPKTPR